MNEKSASHSGKSQAENREQQIRCAFGPISAVAARVLGVQEDLHVPYRIVERCRRLAILPSCRWVS